MWARLCVVHKIAWILVIVGALNWGLVGLFDFNVVMWLLGQWPMVERVVYVLVGIAAVVSLFVSNCGACKKETKM
jgi:uncharacterized protein